ncbi:MAG: hypothetical protein RDV48_24025 [Candidatus Eremiobacteraeota bacterium]|nr:hypothetical protein [Candidatus Eremiobacteraeota bacterium]
MQCAAVNSKGEEGAIEDLKRFFRTMEFVRKVTFEEKERRKWQKAAGSIVPRGDDSAEDT